MRKYILTLVSEDESFIMVCQGNRATYIKS